MVSHKCALQLTHTAQSARPEQARPSIALCSQCSVLPPIVPACECPSMDNDLLGGCSSHPPAPRLACYPNPTRQPRVDPSQPRPLPACIHCNHRPAARRRMYRSSSPLACSCFGVEDRVLVTRSFESRLDAGDVAEHDEVQRRPRRSASSPPRRAGLRRRRGFQRP